MIFKDQLQHSRPLIFWDTVGNLFRAWSTLSLNHRRENKL